jgi:riboflavin synthase
VFTGIISELGVVADVRPMGGGIRISIDAQGITKALKEGDSVAVDGVCQTVVAVTGSVFTVEAVEETLSKTTLGSLKRGSRVNLEPPLRVGDQLGGHFVQGHVDGVGIVKSVTPLADSTMIEVEIPDELARFVVTIGSIALDGISLTVASLKKNCVTVSIIPHTSKHTTLSEIVVGSRVNVECDMLGKYVEKLVGSGVGATRGKISEDLLRQWGYEP